MNTGSGLLLGSEFTRTHQSISTKLTDNLLNQSNLEENCGPRKTRENVCEQATADFGFTVLQSRSNCQRATLVLHFNDLETFYFLFFNSYTSSLGR